MVKRTVSDLDVDGKRVLVRVDFNIPIEQGIEVITKYDQRLRATLPTIRYLVERNCRVILCSHLGRPSGNVVESLRLSPVGDRLAELLARPVQSLSDCVGESVQRSVHAMDPGEITLLENLRFYDGEEQNTSAFAENLASLADFFVMDAFAVAHRAHASTVGVPALLPSAIGFLMQKEVEALEQALKAGDERKPLAALMGGAKVSDKILIIENLLAKLDHLVIGGGMSVTFLHAVGYDTGASPIEEDRLDFATEIIQQASQLATQIHLPLDVVIADRFDPDASQVRTVPVNQIPDGWYVMDIGDSAARRFSEVLVGCKTILWNGPMGVFEMPRFSHGTRAVAEAISSLPDAITVVGGGSTAEATEELGLLDSMTHVSTGGGASLEFLEGKELPGIAALPDV